MTKDLAICIHGKNVTPGEDYVFTEQFLEALDNNLKSKMA